MKLILKKATTSKIVHIFIQDSSMSDGSGLTGLVYNSAGLTAYYIREGDASATAITLATATVGTYTSGGFKEVDATNMPGIYELHLPDACLASGADQVVIFLKGAANMAPLPLEIQLVDNTEKDIYDRIGNPDGASIADDILSIRTDYLEDMNGYLETIVYTRLTAARAGYLDELAAANLPADVDAILADTNELQTDWVNGGRLDAELDLVVARIGVPAMESLAEDIAVVDYHTDDLESRLTAARAGYLDELAAANLPANVDAILADTNELQNDIKKHDNKITGLLM